jgi:O-antigen ligase
MILDPTLRSGWPALVILLVLALLPMGIVGADAPLIVGAIVGLVWAWRERRGLMADPALRLTIILFACYWLPALISAPGAVAAEKSWSTVAGLLRFLPFALFACLGLRDTAVWRRVADAVAMIVVLWLLDAWVQIFTGYSLAGASDAGRLSGIFGAGDLKLGPVLAVLSPFVLNAARLRFGWRGLIVAFVFQLIPILLAGSRAAWLTYALVSLVFAWLQTRSVLRFALLSVAAVCVIALAGLVALHDSTAFAVRVQRSQLALQGSEQALDEAAAGRVRIWGTALRMAAAHPIAGVGARGFRYAYAAYARPGDAFVDPVTGEGASHAHQIVLEVLTETGVIGLALWIFGAACALLAWRRADASARERAFAPGLALAAMCFPLNSHLAFYSAWWGLLFWWLLALYCAALATRNADGA